MQCEHCNLVLKTKYTLKTHLVNSKACLSKRGLEIKTNFNCIGCNAVFINNINLNSHFDICKKYIVMKIKEEYETKIKEQLLLFEKVKEEYETKIKDFKIQNDKLLSTFENIASKVIERPIQTETNISKLIDKVIDKVISADISKVIDKPINPIQPLFINDYYVIYRKDGYIDITNLCKAGNKKFEDWNNLDKTKDFLQVLSDEIRIPSTKLIQYISDGNSKKKGTWVHPQVAINIAQWISSEFYLKVLKWIFELSNIEFDDNSSDEIQIHYKNKIDTLAIKYHSLLVKHNSSLKTHRYIKFNITDPCFYIIESGSSCCNQYKFGITGIEQGNNIDDRLKSHRTLWPKLKVRYLLFMKDIQMIEKSFKMMFDNEINPNGHEIIEGVLFEDMIIRIEKLLHILSLKDYHVMTEDKLKEYNDYVDTTVKVK